jgi:hypothetical protein
MDVYAEKDRVETYLAGSEDNQHRGGQCRTDPTGCFQINVGSQQRKKGKGRSTF